MPSREENHEVTATAEGRKCRNRTFERLFDIRDNAEKILESSKGKLPVLPECTFLATPSIMDERLCEFIEHVWQQGDPRTANQSTFSHDVFLFTLRALCTAASVF